MRIAVRIAVVTMLMAALGLFGCKLETSDLLAADRLIEHLSSGEGSLAERAGSGMSLGPESATRIYYQFVDKKDLFEAVCEDQVRRMIMRLSDETMDQVERGDEELRVGAMLLLDYFAATCCISSRYWRMSEGDSGGQENIL